MGILRDYVEKLRLEQTGWTCDICGVKGKTVPELENLAGANQLTLSGWYGAHIDPVQPLVAILCGQCVDVALKFFFPEHADRYRGADRD